jgi:hypothetical protein
VQGVAVVLQGAARRIGVVAGVHAVERMGKQLATGEGTGRSARTQGYRARIRQAIGF